MNYYELLGKKRNKTRLVLALLIAIHPKALIFVGCLAGLLAFHITDAFPSLRSPLPLGGVRPAHRSLGVGGGEVTVA
jgi:hypothetical protein